MHFVLFYNLNFCVFYKLRFMHFTNCVLIFAFCAFYKVRVSVLHTAFFVFWYLRFVPFINWGLCIVRFTNSILLILQTFCAFYKLFFAFLNLRFETCVLKPAFWNLRLKPAFCKLATELPKLTLKNCPNNFCDKPPEIIT